VALGVREHFMIWEPTNGTEAISSWLNQGVSFGLVLATAMVIGCAVLWAFGSLGGNGQAAGRGRSGIGLSLAAALLLGAGFTYLQWTSSTQAVAFAGDPAQYGINGTPQIPGAWEVIDLSERWTGNIDAYRLAGQREQEGHRRCVDGKCCGPCGMDLLPAIQLIWRPANEHPDTCGRRSQRLAV
jgi:hypothetical protein